MSIITPPEGSTLLICDQCKTERLCRPSENGPSDWFLNSEEELCPECTDYCYPGIRRRWRESEPPQPLAVAAASLRRAADTLDLFAHGLTTWDDAHQAFANAATHADIALDGRAAA